MKSGFLVLEDGFYLPGRIFGKDTSSIGEVVFNTSMTGYQEILTDPSYCGQIVTMTYPLIGNYGVNEQDVESNRIWVKGLVIRELSHLYSNWRATQSLDEYLRRYDIVGIDCLDTRALTRHIRLEGAMQGAIVPEAEMDSIDLWLNRIKESLHLEGRNMAQETSTEATYHLEGTGDRFKVVVVDCGVKKSILKGLINVVKEIVVVPWNVCKEEVISYCPDAVLFSNGPGDPSAVTETIELASSLLGRLPLWGICLGHQLLAIAMGAKTYKLKFGHHGGNHPVKDLLTGRIDITAQNHNFCVDESSLSSIGVEITHRNLYDGTLEGMYSRKWNVISVQFHPEAGPGPFDAQYIFEKFVETINA